MPPSLWTFHLSACQAYFTTTLAPSRSTRKTLVLFRAETTQCVLRGNIVARPDSLVECVRGITSRRELKKEPLAGNLFESVQDFVSLAVVNPLIQD